ncbi:S-layer homology domain-containing protein [Paenibacillus sp. F411]|uniref:S-layer homology domain-containing protein n=1 Tax=Paenibacillus sp. F411 TaxID=2820239 RepID=UPI001AAF1475|nr:S-layer homology domain-containing protein [Paenibacillus sp. F411]MBO2944546.1 S-layer homology domain-containing protein [Paenibacillus sp. F411]
MMLKTQAQKMKALLSLLLSAMLVLTSLTPFSSTAHADRVVYQPHENVTPGYTGPLTWTNYSVPFSLEVPQNEMTYPFFIDIDSQDNVYTTKLSASMTDSAGRPKGKIEKISKDTLQVEDISFGQTFNNPVGIAVDAAGNIYVSDNSIFNVALNHNGSISNVAKIYKLPVGTEEWEDITHGVNMQYAMGIAVDAEGNVYAVDSQYIVEDDEVPVNHIWKLEPNSDTWTTLPGSDAVLNNPLDIAVDGAGNVFVSDMPASGFMSQTSIYKLPAGQDTWLNVTPVSNGMNDMFITMGIHVDPFDNLVVVDFMKSRVLKLPYEMSADHWEELPYVTREQSMIMDVAVDHSGYTYGVNLTGFNIVRLMAAIVYDSNGSTTGMPVVDSTAYFPGETALVLGNTTNMTKTGHYFSGWNTMPDGTGTSYLPDDSITMTESVTLYAVWSQQPTVPTPTPVNLASLKLDAGSYSLPIGATHQTVVTAVYSDQSELQLSSGVEFSSSNTNVAEVNESGQVLALASGTTVITAVYGGQQAQAAVTVPVIAPVPDPEPVVPTPTPAPVNDTPGSTNNTTPVNPVNTGVKIIVDGVEQEQLATAKKDIINGQSVTKILVDTQKVMDKLARENNKQLIIPVSGDSPSVVGQLSGNLIQAMEDKGTEIQMVTDRGSYALPASQIQISKVAEQMGVSIKLEDIQVQIEIKEASKENTAQVEAAAQAGGFASIVQPIDFKVSASSGADVVEINQFESYVTRSIALPDDVRQDNITTGVVLTSDGSLHHVPTMVIEQNGKRYAVINSLSNSTYSVIYNPDEMPDTAGHWANAAVNDMASRLIVTGVSETEFRPNASVTRAEFVAMVLRGLGIQGAAYTNAFTDITADAWYAQTVQAGMNYGLISGYADGSFQPQALISRQEATVVLSRAAAIAELGTAMDEDKAELLLSTFTDGNETAGWARMKLAEAIDLGLIQGRGSRLDVSASLTRAEAAVLVRRMLQAADLINS